MPQLNPETTYPAIVGRVLASTREVFPLEQSELAARLGINQSTWSRIERGETALTVEQLAKAATALGTTAGRILIDADNAVEGLREQGVKVHFGRPKGAAKTGMALIGLAALAFLVARAIKR